MNWDNIKVFVAVARQGSIKQAAKELAVNHSTILRRIDALEKELNSKLFLRLQRGYELTSAGESILDMALLMENDAIALKRQAMAEEVELQGQLTIASTPNTFLDLSPSLIAFRKLHPNIQLNINAGADLINLDKLEADVSLRMTNEPPENCVGKHILDLPFAVYGSPDYLNSCQPIKKASDLNWVIHRVDATGDSMENWLRENDPDICISMKVDNLDLLLPLLKAREGVSYCPQHIAEPHGLKKVDLFGDNYAFNYWALTHGDLRYQPRVQKFMSFIQQDLQRRFPAYIP